MGLISENSYNFVVNVVIVVVLVLLIMLFLIFRNIYRLLTTDYTKLIHLCDQKIASATEELVRAEEDVENYRRCNAFEVLEPGRHKYGYNPNSYEQKVDQCNARLECLKDKRRYYKKQKRMSDELRYIREKFFL